MKHALSQLIVTGASLAVLALPASGAERTVGKSP